MNTSILLAVAGAVALSACTTNKAEIVALPAVPVNESEPAAAKPATPRAVSVNPGFRVPDPTADLYPLRKTATTNRVPAFSSADPLSSIPPTPPPQPVTASGAAGSADTPLSSDPAAPPQPAAELNDR